MGVNAEMIKSTISRTVIGFLFFVMAVIKTDGAAYADFSAQTLKNLSDITVMEVQGDFDVASLNSVDCSLTRAAITKEFYKTHPDSYDFIVIFSNFNFQMPVFTAGGKQHTALAFYSPVNSAYGSKGRLQGTIDMGNVLSLASDPMAPAFTETMNTLSHELLHRWAAYVRYKDKSGASSDALLGLNNSHWSYLFNTKGSLQYGNNWQDNGNGTFTALAGDKYYSPLDLYLMGMIGKADVPPMFLIDNPDIDKNQLPEKGVTIHGNRIDLTIDDIIAASGERVPGVETSQKVFNIAFIVVTRPGTHADAEIVKARNIKKNWNMWFSSLTDGRGRLVINSAPIEDIPENPGAGSNPNDPRELPPSISDAVSWLVSNQTAAGSWKDSAMTECRDTAQAMLALQLFSEGETNKTNGKNWLRGNITENIDYLSRKADVYSSYSMDGSSLSAELPKKQNADGGWGSVGKYVSNPADTSFAMKALFFLGLSHGPNLKQAVDYLKSAQRADGSWGTGENGDITLTTNILETFHKYKNSFDVEESLTRALIWLRGNQNQDGGFGNGQSTIYDTAAAIMIFGLYDDSADTLNHGLEYIFKLQGQDGSWAGSAYQTAWAVRAIMKLAITPDLSISTRDISIDPETISTLPVQLKLKPIIRNHGMTSVETVKVALYEDVPSPERLLEEKVCAVTGLGSTELEFTVTISSGEVKRYLFVVDPDNTIEERSKTNNAAMKLICPNNTPTYDFGIDAGGLSVTPSDVDFYNQVTVKTRIFNHGTSYGSKVPVTWYVSNGAQKKSIASATLDIDAGKTVEHEFSWRTDLSGQDMVLSVVVDPGENGGRYQEVSETNNEASTTLTVRPHTRSNLSVAHTDMAINPLPAYQGGSIAISAIVKNNGFSDATHFTVSCYRGQPNFGEVLIGSQTVASLPAGSQTTMNYEWAGIDRAGEEMITIRINPQANEEISTEDNSAFKVITILSLPDLAVSGSSISFDPPVAKDGDRVTISVTVQNAGNQGVSNVNVRISDNAGVISSGHAVIPAIAGNSHETISVSYETSGKKNPTEIKVVVDPENAIAEQKENNNMAVRSLGIQDSSQWLTETFISPNGDGIKDKTQAFFRFSSPITGDVSVVDKKNNVVKRFSGESFINKTSLSIEWDGRNDKGVIVPDGLYQIRVAGKTGAVMAFVAVIVDNNRSPLTDAVGTDFLIRNNLTCALPDIYKWGWFPDESGLYFMLPYSSNETPEYPAGLYTLSPDGDDIARLVPSAWSTDNDPAHEYTFSDATLSPDGETIGFIFEKKNKNSKTIVLRQLWSVGRYGDHLTCLVSLETSADILRYRFGDSYAYSEMAKMVWKPDSSALAYKLYDSESKNTQIWTVETTHPNHAKKQVGAVTGQTSCSLEWDPSGHHISVSTYYNITFLNVQEQTSKIIGLGRIEKTQWLNKDRLLVYTAQENDTLPGYNIYTYIVNIFNSSGDKVIDGIEGLSIGLGNSSAIGVVNPDRRSFAYNSTEGKKWYVRVCDENGNIKTVHETEWLDRRFGTVTDMTWSPDGSHLAFVDHAYKKFDSCTGEAHAILVNMETSEKKQAIVSDGEDWCNFPESYHLLSRDGGTWAEKGVLHFGTAYDVQTLDITDWFKQENSQFRLRVNHQGSIGAHIDSIAIVADGFSYYPVKAEKTLTGESITGDVMWHDGNVADVFNATVDFTWEGIPQNAAKISLELFANEGMREPLSFWGGSLRLFRDNASVVYNAGDKLGVLNMGEFDEASERGRSFIPVPGIRQNLVLSPQGRYLVYDMEVPWDSVCAGRGWSDLWAMTSVMNLTANLRVKKGKSAITLKGTAADINLDHYTLEYAHSNTPDTWALIQPPSNLNVIDGDFAIWVPPAEGTYYVRLTVYDKAGNSLSDRKRVSWGMTSSVTGIYKTYEFFSPNNDGVMDQAELNYTVMEPAHLEFTLLDQSGTFIRTVLKNHSTGGKQTFVWDGTDGAGNTVPDGVYEIRLLDFTFFYTLDNTPPESYLNMEYSSVFGALGTIIYGYADDPNLKEWLVEYQLPEYPGKWNYYEEGTESLIGTDLFGNRLYDKSTGKPAVENLKNGEKTLRTSDLLGGKAFKITASDKAGNFRSWTAGKLKDMAVITRWNDKDLSLRYSKADNEFVTMPISSEYILPQKNKFNIEYSFSQPGVIINLQIKYYNDDKWINVGKNSEVDEMEYFFSNTCDLSGIDKNEISFIRIKAVYDDGKVYYSIPVEIAMMLRISYDEASNGYNAHQPYRGSNGSNNNDNSIIGLEFQRCDKSLSKQGLCDDKDWETYASYNLARENIPSGKFSLPLFLVNKGDCYFVRMRVKKISGEYVNSVAVDYPHGCSNDLKDIIVVYPVSDMCGEVSDSVVLIKVKSPSPIKPEYTPESIDYYIHISGEDRLLDHTVNPTWVAVRQLNSIWYEIDPKLNVNTSEFPPGTYTIKAILNYEDASQTLQEFLVVDREPPVSKLTYPAGTMVVCPRLVRETKGSCIHDWYQIDIEGEIKDNRSIEKYELYYGIGDKPDTWISAKGREAISWKCDDNGKTISGDSNIEGEKSVQGLIGSWKVGEEGKLNIKGTVSLLLKVWDKNGNLSCDTVSFDIKPLPGLMVSKNTGLVSPNGDDVKDSVALTYTIDEYAVVYADVFKVTKDADDKEILTKVRTLMEPEPLFAGSFDLVWDGLNDGGLAVDGVYYVRFYAEDACGNISQKDSQVEVDNTPPQLMITWPMQGDPIGVITEVMGSVGDEHLSGYLLQAVNDADGRSPVKLGEGKNTIHQGFLGKWNTTAYDGIWTLTLTATDAAGNKGEHVVDIDLGSRMKLIKDLKAEPRLFSPNNDGKSDTAKITYILNDAFNDTYSIIVEIINTANHVVRSMPFENIPAGERLFEWDGSGVNDGQFVVKVKASLTSNPGTQHEETVTVVRDTTAPVVEMSPENQEWFKTDTIRIKGSVSDDHILEYSVTCTRVDSGVVYSQTETVNRKDYTFALLNDLAEGEYRLDIKAKDHAENETIVNHAFFIDKTPPKTSLDKPESGSFWGGEKREIPVEGSITELNPSTWQLRYGSGDAPAQWITLVSGQELPVAPQILNWTVGQGAGIPDGRYSLALSCIDKAGWESQATRTVIIDNTSPLIDVTSHINGGYMTKPAQFMGTIFDGNLKSYTVDISEGDCGNAFRWSPIRTGTANVENGILASLNTLPIDGTYCLRLTALDLSGNKTEKLLSFTIDTVPPAAPVLEAKVENKSSVKLEWIANSESDLDGYNIYRDGAKVNTSVVKENLFVDLDMKEGAYTYTVKAVDKAGLESQPSNEVKVIVDFTPPTARIQSPRDGSVISDLIHVTGTAYSEEDFKEYRLYMANGAAPDTWILIRQSPLAVSYGSLAENSVILQDGETCSLKLEAEDISGNVNTHQVTFTADTVPPAAPVLNPVEPPAGSSVTLTWTANGEGDIAGYLLYRNDRLVNATGVVVGDLTQYLLTGTGYTDSGLADGTYVYTLEAVDKAGNISARSNSVEVTIDTRVPVVTLQSPKNGTKFENNLVIVASSEDLDIASVRFQYKAQNATEWANIDLVEGKQTWMATLDPVALSLGKGVYALRAVATDIHGKTGPTSPEVTVELTDVTPPAVPKNITALVSGEFATLNWDAQNEIDLAGFNVYNVRGETVDKMNGDTVIQTTTFVPNQSTGGLENGDYELAVTSVDTYGNESRRSAPIAVKIYAPIVDQPPAVTALTKINISGTTAVGGSVVALFNDIGAGPVSMGTVTALADGRFTYEMTPVQGNNTVTALATDLKGNISKRSNAVTVRNDLVPTPPANVSATVSGSNVLLQWTTVDTDIKGYAIYKDSGKGWALITPDLHTTSPFTDANVKNGTYSYKIKAVDIYDLESDFSATVTITVNVEKPIAPSGLRVDAIPAEGGKIHLCWLPSGQPFGFTLYRSTTTGTGYSLAGAVSGAETCYTDSGLKNGVTYFYVVRATDSAGNESPDSNEVFAVPADSALPPAPVIFYPTESGKTLQAEQSITTICGFSDNADQVELFNNQVSVGSVSSRSTDSVVRRAIENADTDYFSISDSGEFVAYSENGILNVFSITEDSKKEIANSGWAKFAPGSDSIVYNYSNGMHDKIAVYNLKKGTLTTIDSGNQNSYDYLSGWSHDGASVVYESCDGDGCRLRMANIETGTMTAITDVNNGIYPTYAGFSPDGKNIAFCEIDENTNETVLYFKNIESGKKTKVSGDKNVIQTYDQNPYEWSPDGSHLAYLAKGPGSGILYLFDLNENIEIRVSPSESVSGPLWSADGKRVAFIDGGTPSPTLVVYQPESQIIQSIDSNVTHFNWAPGGEKLAYVTYDNANSSEKLHIITLNDVDGGRVVSSEQEFATLSMQWTKSGKINRILKSGMDVQVSGIEPAGTFRFDLMPLSVGTNRFHAVSSDNSGNVGPASDFIEIIMNAEDLPDLAVEKSGIVLVPVSPVEGEVVTGSVTVSNKGKIRAENIGVNIWMWNADNDVRLIKKDTIAFLDGNSEGYVPFKIDSADISGENEIMVEIDQENLTMESDESNNYAMRTFYVSKEVGLTLEISLDQEHYGSHSDVLGDLTIFNNGRDIEGVMGVRVVDTEGNLVEHVENKNILLAYGSKDTLSFTWNTADYFAGNYFVKASVYDSEGLIKEATVPFTIDLSADAEADISTDKASYEANDDVVVKVGVLNSGELYTIPALTARTTITGPLGTDLFTEDFEVVNLFSGSRSSRSHVWTGNSKAPGEYTATVRLWLENEVVDEQSVHFTVNSSVEIKGAISSNITLASPGDAVILDYSVTSSGNEAPGVVPVNIAVIHSETGEIVYTLDKTATLGVEETWSEQTSFATTGMAMASYSIVLRRGIQGGFITLASTPLRISDLLKPTIVINSPKEGVTYIGPLNVDVTARDNASGVEKVEFRIDNKTNWLPMANTEPTEGRWFSRWTPVSSDAGSRRIEIRATDRSGNVSSVLSGVFFVVMPYTEITGSISVTPEKLPSGSAAQAAYQVRNAGNTTARNLRVSLFVIDPATAEKLVTEERTLDLGANKTYSGSYTINTQGFADKTYTVRLEYIHPGTGELTLLSSDSFTVSEAVPPVVTILSPVSGKTYNSPFELSVSATDSGSGMDHAEYRINSGAWQQLPVKDSAAGIYSTTWNPANSPAEGLTVSFRAYDKNGNVSDPVSVTVGLEVISPFEKLTGALTLSTTAPFKWHPLAIDYRIENSTTKSSGPVTVMVSIVDTVTGTVKMSFNRSETIAGNTFVLGRFTIDSLTLAEKSYNAVFRVKDAEKGTRDLDSVPFTVRKTIEAESVVRDPINLLVWVNDNCQVNMDTNTGTSCNLEKCIRTDLLEAILKKSTTRYYLVYDKETFAEEVRNPFYTDILVLGNSYLPDLTTAYELIEKVNSGTGLASSLWMKHQLELNIVPLFSTIFGVNWNGLVLSLDHTIETTASAITVPGSFPAQGIANIVSVTGQNAVTTGWIKKNCQLIDKFPGIVLNTYGGGKTAYFAFDLGLSLKDETYSVLSEIITKTIANIHTKKVPGRAYPGTIVPVQMEVTSHSGEAIVALTETFTSPLKLYDVTSGGLKSESPATIKWKIPGGTPIPLTAYFLTPDFPGSYNVSSATQLLLNGLTIPVNEQNSVIKVDVDTEAFINEILSDIKSLKVSFLCTLTKVAAVNSFLKVKNREIISRADSEKNIRDIIETIKILKLIVGTDINPVRAKLDQLMKMEECWFYFFEE